MREVGVHQEEAAAHNWDTWEMGVSSVNLIFFRERGERRVRALTDRLRDG